jgi:hypothetical protein
MPWFGGVRDIHMGTSWDYLKFRNKNTKILLMQLAAGLIQIIKEIETGRIDRGVLFRGNSHFLSEENLQKVGFAYRNPNPVENFLFFLTYLEDCILRSISARRLILIPFRNNKIVHFTGEDLLRNKERIKKIYLALSGYKKRREESIPQIEMNEEFINVA